jgi:hypothetical protein
VKISYFAFVNNLHLLNKFETIWRSNSTFTIVSFFRFVVVPSRFWVKCFQETQSRQKTWFSPFSYLAKVFFRITYFYLSIITLKVSFFEINLDYDNLKKTHLILISIVKYYFLQRKQGFLTIFRGPANNIQVSLAIRRSYVPYKSQTANIKTVILCPNQANLG